MSKFNRQINTSKKLIKKNGSLLVWTREDTKVDPLSVDDPVTISRESPLWTIVLSLKGGVSGVNEYDQILSENGVRDRTMARSVLISPEGDTSVLYPKQSYVNYQGYRWMLLALNKLNPDNSEDILLKGVIAR